MGEIFRREVAETPEPFTGERLTAAIDGQVQVEHYHRYLFARSLARDLDVLDVASGEGYGSALLAQVAHSVIGLEYSQPTVLGARANFPRANLSFVQGDARSLPFPDASFGAVVSFETIEHFDRQDAFVREVRRVLRPDGRFIVSTPDRDVYSHPGAPVNPYHIYELSQEQFVALLHASFSHVALLRQRPLLGSALLAETASALPPLVFERRSDTHFEANTGLARAPYIVAVASDASLPPLPPTVYIDRSDIDTDRQRAVSLSRELKAARQERDEAVARADNLQGQLDWMRGSLPRMLRSYLSHLRKRGQRP